jgi:hypothetical protein
MLHIKTIIYKDSFLNLYMLRRNRYKFMVELVKCGEFNMIQGF